MQPLTCHIKFTRNADCMNEIKRNVLGGAVQHRRGLNP